MPGIGVTASLVRIMPCIIQGCRPTSVTVHPASTAINPKGVDKINRLRNHFFASQLLFFHTATKYNSPMPIMVMPIVIIDSKAR